MATVAILKRAIPVEGMLTDTNVKVCTDNTSVNDLLAWQDKMCSGSCVPISLEIVREQLT